MAHTQDTDISATVLAGMAWKEYKKYLPFWLTLSVFTAIPAIILNILATSVVSGETNEEVTRNYQAFIDGITPEKIMLYIGIGIALLIASLFVYAVEVTSSLYIAQKKKQLDIGAALAMGAKNFGRIAVISILLGLVIIAGLFMFLFPALLFALWYGFVMQVSIDEKMSIKEVFARSKVLYRSNRKLVIFTILTIFGISILASYVVQIIAAGLTPLSAPLAIVATGVASTLINTYTGFTFTTLYLHLKKS